MLEDTLRQFVGEYHGNMINWKSLVGKYLQYVNKTTNKVAKNIVSVVRTNTQHKEEMVGYVQQKSP